MTEESTLTEDGLAKRIADFAASFAANQKALADLAPIGNPNMVAMLAEAALSDRGDGFACYVAENLVAIRAAALRSEEVCTVLVMGYELGISVGSAACMNDLGALYYMGELVPQDYARAAKLYEQAMDHGCFQSIINLGYIYEYGRAGEADHQKAYQCYALASALQPSCEAVYKLGDMYSRGEAVPSSMGKACQLWERSLELAGSVVEAAQPSVRIAKAIVNPSCEEWGEEYDPLRALSLFQQAEIGLRIDISKGATYYRRRLTEAIEGQDLARQRIVEKATAEAME